MDCFHSYWLAVLRACLPANSRTRWSRPPLRPCPCLRSRSDCTGGIWYVASSHLLLPPIALHSSPIQNQRALNHHQRPLTTTKTPIVSTLPALPYCLHFSFACTARCDDSTQLFTTLGCLNRAQLRAIAASQHLWQCLQMVVASSRPSLSSLLIYCDRASSDLRAQ